MKLFCLRVRGAPKILLDENVAERFSNKLHVSSVSQINRFFDAVHTVVSSTVGNHMMNPIGLNIE